jgi:NAD(P)-dependent dehydrogenase (short-subunit alcohol dehydrogenase family)
MESARVVLVTNVGQGFGRAVALASGQAGYDVVCADPDVDLASKTAAEVEELGGQAIPVQADASLHLDVRGAFSKVFEIFGALGGVVHVACHQSQTPFVRLTDTEFAELMAENVTSTYLVLREAARHLDLGWVVVVAPPPLAERPQMAAVHGAVTGMATAFSGGGSLPTHPDALDLADIGAPEPVASARPRVNVVVPSRPASDPRHDARLSTTVRFLGSDASRGVVGAAVSVDLPPPPRVIETLLPEVQAALDDSLRQVDIDDADEEDDAVDDLEDDTGVDDDEDGMAGGPEADEDSAVAAALEAEGLDDGSLAARERELASLGRGEAPPSTRPFGPPEPVKR